MSGYVSADARLAAAKHPLAWGEGTADRATQHMGGTMDATNFRELDDPALIAERRRVREQFDRLPARDAERIDLEARFDLMTRELDRRASVAWGETEA